MPEIQDPLLVDGKYSIHDLVDLKQLEDLFQRFYLATGFTIGFLDHPQMNVLMAIGWREICTKFYRGSPVSAEICRKSNQRLLFSLHSPGQTKIEACENLLVDCATPIIIKGVHIASLATGQFLFEEPDLEEFRKHAKLCGFDETQYFKALEAVPVVDKTQAVNVTAFLGSLAAVISEMGYNNIIAKERALILEDEISQRKILSQKLRESEEKYRILIDTTNTGYVILDENGFVIDANNEYARLTGRQSLEEIIGHKVTEWTALYDQARMMKKIRKCFDSRTVHHMEIDYVDRNENIIPAEINGSAISDSTIFALTRDISERKKAESDRLKMERNLLQTQKLEGLGIMAGGIAHDFNNMLTGILGNADLTLLEPNLPEPVKQHLDKILMAAKQAAELCHQMLAYAGKGRFVVQKLNLKELVKKMVAMLEVSLSKKVALKYFLDEDVPAIEGDLAQIRQVIMNLIINASEAIGDNVGTISLFVETKHCDAYYLSLVGGGEEVLPGEYVCLEVRDTGCGIDEATRAKIFDPFYTTKNTGRGLGLAAVIGIVRGHKGFINIYSELGHGTSFRVFFPAIEGEFDQIPKDDLEILKWQGSGTIIFADDTEVALYIGQKILERFGFQVLTARDGQEAIDLFTKISQEENNNLVCVILDVSMPKKSGFEVFQEIRAVQPDMPIILSSGYNEQDTIVRLGRNKKVAFIPKPYEVKVFAAKLKALLESDND